MRIVTGAASDAGRHPLLRTLWILPFLLTASCDSCLDTIVVQQLGGPLITVNTERLDFGDTVVGTEETRELQVLNSGQAALELTDVRLLGLNRDSFFYDFDPTTLEPSETKTLTIRFSRTLLGNLTASILITSNADNDDPAVDLTGTGIEAEQPPPEDGGQLDAAEGVDAGTIDDAGPVPVDAGLDAGSDAGLEEDDGGSVHQDAGPDPCANACFPGVECTVVNENAVCGDCPPGFEGDGISCVDDDGCSPDPCFPGVPCMDAQPPLTGYTCGECPDGYDGDGETCTLIVCTALSLDGQDDLVDIGEPPALQFMLTGSFSFQAWILLDSLGGNQAIYSRGDGAGVGENENYLLQILPGGEVFFDVRGEAGEPSEALIVSTEQIPLATWTHIHGSREFGVETRLYINGSLVGSVPDVAGQISFSQQRPLYLGAHYDAETSLLNYHLDGMISNFRIWDRVLEPAEVALSMEASFDASASPGIAAVWSYDEGVGTTAGDAEGTSPGTIFSGSIQSATWVETPEACHF